MAEKALMIQGTTSNAGKSTVAAGLCRLLKRRGIAVAPFKPQNMALNSAVTIDGGEIGRAQAVQAEACGLEPHSDMNPILLKPNSQCGSQVIVQGKVLTNMEAAAFHAFKPQAMKAVVESFDRLTKQFDFVVVEGAGSPAEINLRAGDIANMGFAEAADCPVVLVADIDRGGVFAHIVGTMSLLSESERNRVKGFIINRFRGDINLLKPGVDWLEANLSKPVLGVLPFLEDLHLEAEDSLSAEGRTQVCSSSGRDRLKVVVPVTPRLSNQTDFDALNLHPQVELVFLRSGESMPPADLIILGGSKNVSSDLAFMFRQNWVDSIKRHLRFGGKLIGICGGFQMLGRSINDPLGIESESGSSLGLGFLDMDTTLEREKQLGRVEGRLTVGNIPVSGYEIHMGVSRGPALAIPAVLLDERADGAVCPDNQIIGTYLHGLFDHPKACQALLSWAGLQVPEEVDYRQLRITHIDRLADMLESHLRTDVLAEILSLPINHAGSKVLV